MEVIINLMGWAGSIMVLVAYGLNSYQRLKSDALTFYLLNLVGGIFLVIYTVYKEAFANTFINVVWVVIAVIALGKRWVKKNP